jgi:outer membrane protein
MALIKIMNLFNNSMNIKNKFPLKMTIIGGILVGACIIQADTLSLKEYVRLALRHNPQQKIAASTVAAKSAAVESARSNLMPQIDGKASIARSKNIPTAPTKNSASAGVEGTILLYDFGANPLHYRAAGTNLEAAKYDSQSAMASLIVNAHTVYFNYLLSIKLLAVNEDALKQATIHFDQAKSLFDVGRQAKIAITKARVDVANAEVNVIHSKNAKELAKVQMGIIAGIPLAEPLTLADSLSALEDTISLSDALSLALQQKPEICSQVAALEAARMQLKAARAAFLPSLSANGSVNLGADNSPGRSWNIDNAPTWKVAAMLSIPIYDGGNISASVKQADAAFKQAEAQLDALKQSVTQQVQQYFLQEKEALQRIGATAALIEQAEESLKMSQERFRAGVAFSVEITDAEVTLANARASNAQAQFDYHVAHANLVSAMGSLHE